MADPKIHSPKKRTPSKSETDKRRTPSFSNTSSPWFRRNSFLSPAMIHSENISVYECPNYYSDSSTYNIISLKECQGFIFNQDLFASPYQQQRTLISERKLRAMSHSFHKSRSNSSSHSRSNSMSGPTGTQRRHTSYHGHKPVFATAIIDNSAIEDDDEDVSNSSVREAFNQFENTTVDIELDTQDEDIDGLAVEDADDVDVLVGEGTGGMYKVHVTEIVVNDSDDIFPVRQ
ncbi:hypothetical protein CANTEDRAFT_114997 [Yamadazyma tenuis ATCC 10573]|uniref:Uncharacterized protein n=1 Tax=Candida tenuis (strain ATCC 10573 / BCRC 21748 / CBS 615 / JCM 9827 / NBRC 10315 / NRRL Y-1498 / VKM Y-70) TaxID=590646 RepID=G3BBA2_CANTC|nr:uncharacterized protein CANTEDRAFT_114997 [Yamadazyma tenuis ATCC 10573]EGV61528.1 hypothetical protein CANTEDRAFT_114997 [Yamadazyma tenuis ATCC 10573]